jgi:dihydroflavonol-4-reductase
MKVLLTGATGFLGSEIARELVRQGHALRVFTRPTSKLDGLAGLVYEREVGDMLDAAALDRALEGVDALIHTAGATSVRPRDGAEVLRVNVEAARTVMTAAARRPGLRVVYTSSTAAIGASDTPRFLDERTTWNMGAAGLAYATSKKLAEDVVLEFAAKGLQVVILNPGMLFGPGDVYLTSTKYILEYLRGKNRFVAPGGLSFADVREVARAHVTALTKGRVGERYILAGQNQRHAEVLTTLQSMTGLYRPIRLPYALLWLGGVLSEVAARVHTHPLEDLSLGFVRWSKMFAFMEVTKAQRELDYVVRPFDETVRDTVRDFIARGLVPAATPALAALRPARA